MGANLNKNEHSYFIFDAPEGMNGAIAVGNPNYVEDYHFSSTAGAAGRDASEFTWLVCPHLSQPEQVYRYYLASGLIVIVLGKCFCERCLDKIASNTDLSELIGAGRPMTDRLFQQNFIGPLMDSNFNFMRLSEYGANFDPTVKTWITCAHTSQKHSLKKAYAGGGQLFIFEGFFTCQDCFEKIPTDSLVDLLHKGESMSDDLFQSRIIDSLYDVNYESLDAVGHFDFCRTNRV
jgi:hypothetical protein